MLHFLTHWTCKRTTYKTYGATVATFETKFNLKSQISIIRESQMLPIVVTLNMQTDDLQSLLSVPSTMIHNIYVMASNAHTFYHTTRHHSMYPISGNSYLPTSIHDIVPCTKPHVTFIPSSLSTRHSSVYLTANNTHTFFPHHTVLFCVPDS